MTNKEQRRKSKKTPSKDLVKLVEACLEDNKAENAVSIDLAGKSDIADYMVVASGRSQRHVAAVAGYLCEMLKAQGISRVDVEGTQSADWVLIDAGDIVIHLFRPEVRDYYNLEKMWGVDLPVPTDNSMIMA